MFVNIYIYIMSLIYLTCIMLHVCTVKFNKILFNQYITLYFSSYEFET